jgi:hypothetical protein
MPMNQCPVCSSEIQDAFGLTECPGCHKILFADFDGVLKVQEEAHAADDFLVTEAPTTETNNFSDDWNASEEAAPISLENLDPLVEPEPEAELSAIAEEAPAPVFRETPSAIDEINTFANSDESSLKNGALLYNLTVTNIDTEDLKREIIDILKESKLNIDVLKLKFSLPTLELKDLNPIKASVIVSKIKHLPVDVEWIQKSVLSEGDSNVD